MLPYVLPSTHLRTVGRPAQRDSTQDCMAAASNTPYHLAPVTTRSIPHQRFDVRVMLQAIDCRRYSRRPTPQQPAPPNVYHQNPLVDHALADAPSLHDGPTPCGPCNPTRISSAKPKAGSELTPAPARAQLKPPFSTTPAHLRLPSHDGPSEPSGFSSNDAARLVAIQSLISPAVLNRPLDTSSVEGLCTHLPLYTSPPTTSALPQLSPPYGCHPDRTSHSRWSRVRDMSTPSVPSSSPIDSKRSTHHRMVCWPQHGSTTKIPLATFSSPYHQMV